MLAGAPALRGRRRGRGDHGAAASPWALRTAAPATPRRPGRWSRTARRGPDRRRRRRPARRRPDRQLDRRARPPALALLPSAAGALWAGQHLWKLADAFPRALAGVPACAVQAPGDARRATAARRARVGAGAGATARRRCGRALARPCSRALARLVALTVAGSAALLADARLAPAGAGAGVLAGVRRRRARHAARRAARVARAAGARRGSASPPAWRPSCSCRLAGAAVRRRRAARRRRARACWCCCPRRSSLLARPARTLATALWIT